MENETGPGNSGTANPVKGYLSSINFNWILSTAKKIAFSPVTAWPDLKAEPKNLKTVLLDYTLVLIVLAVGAKLLVNLAHSNIVRGIGLAISQLVMFVGAYYLMAFLAQKVATFFAASPSVDDTAKLIGFSQTVPFVAMAITTLLALPAINVVVLLAASGYGFYTLYKGVPVMTGIAQEKAGLFTIAIIGAAIAVSVIIGMVQTTILYNKPVHRPTNIQLDLH